MKVRPKLNRDTQTCSNVIDTKNEAEVEYITRVLSQNITTTLPAGYKAYLQQKLDDDVKTIQDTMGLLISHILDELEDDGMLSVSTVEYATADRIVCELFHMTLDELINTSQYNSGTAKWYLFAHKDSIGVYIPIHMAPDSTDPEQRDVIARNILSWARALTKRTKSNTSPEQYTVHVAQVND